MLSASTAITEVDKLAGFDRILAELAALLRPADLDAQLRQANMPRTRLIHACLVLADEPYILAIVSDRFSTSDWRSLPLESLEQLRNTLAARHSKKLPERAKNISNRAALEFFI